MKRARILLIFALVIPIACGGGSNAPAPGGTIAPTSTPVPTPTASSSPATSGSENIAPGPTATIAPLPNIGGIYGGQIVLPPGSGTATLTFSLTAPPGIPALIEYTPSPQIAYITITADSAFTLASNPGLNLSVPMPYLAIVMWLNYYGGGQWQFQAEQSGWPGSSQFAAMCFKPQGGSISLQQGQSVYLGITGDDVIPTPIPTGSPAPCPQPA